MVPIIAAVQWQKGNTRLLHPLFLRDLLRMDDDEDKEVMTPGSSRRGEFFNWSTRFYMLQSPLPIHALFELIGGKARVLCRRRDSSAIELLEVFVITAKSEGPWAAEGVRAERVRIVETKRIMNI